MSRSGKIRVLLVDDSLFMRVAIKRMIAADPRFEVVGEARDGAEAVEKCARLEPDVISMDVNMPKMDGVTAVGEIMKRRPTPVVMLSAHTRDGARSTVEALAAGAVDFLAKPAGEVSTDLSSLAAPLVEKLAAAARARPAAPEPARPRPPSPTPRSAMAPAPRRSAQEFPVVVIGVSTGGPSALARVFPGLGGLQAAIVVVQHMPEHFTGALAERLDAMSPVRVFEARDGDRLRAGMALVAPGNRHLEMTAAGTFRLGDGPHVSGCRPSADVTMRSVALKYQERCVGVIMTGMGSDGVDGLQAIKAHGGRTFAQDEASCAVYGMPKVAMERGLCDEVVRLDDLAGRLVGL